MADRRQTVRSLRALHKAAVEADDRVGLALLGVAVALGAAATLGAIALIAVFVWAITR